MAQQVIRHGATIDAATPEEVARLLERLKGIDTNIVIGDETQQRQTLDHFPVESEARIVVPRRPITGPNGNQVAVDQNGELALPGNKTRLAGSVVNIGANPVFIHTGETVTDLGPAIGWLSASGGSWDMKISDLLWVGGILARCAAGLTSTLLVVEF